MIFHVAIGPDTPLSAQVLSKGGGTQVLTGSELHNARNNFKNQLDSGKIADTCDVRHVDFIAGIGERVETLRPRKFRAPAVPGR